MQRIEEGFEPDISFERGEVAELYETVRTPGMRHINRIIKGEVDKLVIRMMNMPEGNDSEILAAHKLSKAAAMIYDGLVRRINNEMASYVAPKVNERPIDPTEGLLDLGDLDEDISEEGLYE